MEKIHIQNENAPINAAPILATAVHSKLIMHDAIKPKTNPDFAACFLVGVRAIEILLSETQQIIAKQL